MSDLQREVEAFLYHEARLLDAMRLREWLELLTDDARYVIPVGATRYPANSKALTQGEGSSAEAAWEEEGLPLYDDDKQSLTTRVARLETGLAWAEDPPSRTRHIVTNVEIEAGTSDSEVRAYSNLVVHRTRFEHDSDLLIGAREDLLRRVDGQWKLARRKVLLDQPVFDANNLSIFL